ncbi:MAG: patatin-like phospholipase family protein [Actinomycetota bacterium]|nr:patatin-like phospholipase family protein [Actinomycetota bacterium]
MAQTENRVDLVLEGGGVKGVGLAGAYSVLIEQGFDIANVAGTSAGAITAAAIAAGFTPDELRQITLELDYRQFEDKGWEDRLPVLEKTTSLLLDLGIHEGNRFHEWMRELLARKNVHTFADLVWDEDEAELRYRYKLQVIASDVTNRQLLILPRDAKKKLGVEPDELEVALAVRMSMSIPIFFEPVHHQNPQTGEEIIIVDGGMLSNFPVWLFDSDGIPDYPTFGLLLVEPNLRAHLGHQIEPPRKERGVAALVDYLKSLAQTMMAAHDRLYVEQADYARTILIPTLGVKTTEFDITRERALALYESGRKAAEEFLETWDFEAYIASFRSEKGEPSRRDVLVASMEEPVAAGGG